MVCYGLWGWEFLCLKGEEEVCIIGERGGGVCLKKGEADRVDRRDR
jgi:hypothetical protein